MLLKSIGKTLISIFLIALVFLCIAFQNEISIGVYASLERSVTRIIPSLFAMTVLSSVIQRCGIIDKLFIKSRSNPGILSCFVFGNVGGYPIGAKLISDGVSRGVISKQTAEQVISFSYGCGPSFAIGVSYAIYGNSIYGLLSFASITLANLIIYVIYTLKKRPTKEGSVSKEAFSTALVVECISNAAKAMISITAMIAAFSVLISLLECLFPRVFVSILPSIFEISRISELYYPPLALTTAILAFGGLCVHMQVVALVNDSFSLKQFYITRLVQIPIASGISAVFDYLLRLSGSVTASSPNVHISQSNSIIPLICILAMISIVFLSKIKRRTA